MNTKHAQYMLTVLQEGNITNAAKKLYVSQPSLSQMIKLVETNLGAPIFNRNTDPITLTFAGQKYIESAKQVLTINSNLQREIEEITHEDYGKIRLGIPVQRA
ncbi:MAG: LysR family transcriptional regulator, partial [Hungatella sp.]